MNEKKKEISNEHHPLVIESEEKQIEVRKPPNTKIISYKMIDKNTVN